jgi:capsular polysaccharide transport system ATP-binding protein
MLSIRNLTKSYKTKAGRHFVFRNTSVDFPENVNIGILGHNGSGKSTLLRILGGIDFPDSGTILCDKRMSWPLGLRGGFVGNLSGRDNCRMICNLYGLDRKTIGNKLEFIKEFSGINHYFEEPVKYFSSGMSSRLGFALSMAFDFEILLMDEITSVGDRDFRKKAKQMIDDKREQSNIIFVSHSMSNIQEFCDVGVLLVDGQVTVFDNVEEAIKAYMP